MPDPIETTELRVGEEDILVYIMVFKDVKNIKDLKPMLMDGRINVALVSAKKVCHSAIPNDPQPVISIPNRAKNPNSQLSRAISVFYSTHRTSRSQSTHSQETL